ncbi:hypothetical protein EIP91_005949 [Steccherinum ochraceum]|uniref:F-box domain-containing protein n=1 Tax=Steccherinum ochraceum TaxID=92696 RepID=A0A4R0RRP2_9APHY|nr:hypothetical protein EIP91_005949 [Steccherinum ochraceum]
MDSDDEKLIEEMDAEFEENARNYPLLYPELKHFQNKERETIANGLAPKADFLGVVRITRLMLSLSGFSEGHLDLSGRFESRYTSLVEQWNALLRDFEPMMRTLGNPFAVRSMEVDLKKCPAYEVTSDDIYYLESKWRIFLNSTNSPSLLYGLLNTIDEVATVLHWKRPPIFQKLLFLHLPPELLRTVFDELDRETAYLLGATCRLLREVSMPYVNRHRWISLPKLDRDKLPLGDEPGTMKERESAALEALTLARTAALEKMASMKDSPSVLNSLESLTVGGEWQREDIALAKIRSPSTTFFAPLHLALAALLKSTRHLHTMVFQSWYLVAEHLQVLFTIKTLRTLAIHASPAVGALRSIRRSTSILNFHLRIDKPRDTSSWLLLARLPNLRTLSVMCSDPDEGVLSVLPSPAIRASVNPFKSVEYFFASNIVPLEIEELSAWIISAKTTYGQLRLTHFKLEANFAGFELPQITTILDALTGAPIRSFSLDGIHYASPDIFTRINAAFPNLEILALHYRQSLRQENTTCAYWPSPTWEYARALGHCTKLKHLIWNQRYHPFEYPSPVLELMESEEWSGAEANEEARPVDWHYDDEESFNHWVHVIKLFAVHCTTLETVSFLSGEYYVEYIRQYVIERSEGVVVRSCSDWSALDMEENDPEHGWPDLFTDAPKDQTAAST